MSDPDREGPYHCHGPMTRLSLMDLTGVADTPIHDAVWVCMHRMADDTICGVWRHGYHREESQLRALVEARMPTFIESMNEKA